MFRTLVADPPWLYKDKAGTGRASNSASHFDCLPTEQICRLNVQAVLEKDAVCLLWTTNAFLHDAFHVLESWGFTYKACHTWCKKGPGPGVWARHNTEHFLVGTCGRYPAPKNTDPKILTTWHPWRRTGKLAAKPPEFYELARQFYPGPTLELFARNTQPGWSSWGNEVYSDVALNFWCGACEGTGAVKVDRGFSFVDVICSDCGGKGALAA